MYAIISRSAECNLILQNLADTIGSFEIHESSEECHAIAVPCHVGPQIERMSSGAVNMSLEVVRNSKEENSEESFD